MNLPSLPRRRFCKRSRSGQALLETIGIMVLLCMLLFGTVQYVLMLTAQEVVQYAADAGVRARTVGFNTFMVRKVVDVASIPNSGQMTSPEDGVTVYRPARWENRNLGFIFTDAIASRPGNAQYREIEQYNIPLYLGSENYARAYGYLDYERWEDEEFRARPGYTGITGETIGVRVRQDYPLVMPFVRGVWSSDDEIPLEASSYLAHHSDLYLQ